MAGTAAVGLAAAEGVVAVPAVAVVVAVVADADNQFLTTIVAKPVFGNARPSLRTRLFFESCFWMIGFYWIEYERRHRDRFGNCCGTAPKRVCKGVSGDEGQDFTAGGSC